MSEDRILHSGLRARLMSAEQAAALIRPRLLDEMLRRRPDVRVAERQLAAQSALIGVAEAELYPAITLLGTLGISATSGSRLSMRGWVFKSKAPRARSSARKASST